ncbi:hypothetical protein Y1Q_0002865 [Alligator mississippiensis]|uniref:Reverse transcriptase/retrotransposon-derived protein RNase H-like domain-containing protein n=1 Tax=Alligator mississippiensis TaxID=8496 RepID=A0A151NZE3_ALLMI|nr:hypothetical protein Y1Q_0002865 [Alligator mississippiensis]
MAHVLRLHPPDVDDKVSLFEDLGTTPGPGESGGVESMDCSIRKEIKGGPLPHPVVEAWVGGIREDKKALCQDAVVETPDSESPFILQADASDRALGAVPLQEVNGTLWPVAYARKLNPQETSFYCYAALLLVTTGRGEGTHLQSLRRMPDTTSFCIVLTGSLNLQC